MESLNALGLGRDPKDQLIASPAVGSITFQQLFQMQVLCPPPLHPRALCVRNPSSRTVQLSVEHLPSLARGRIWDGA